jgi:uncharacterized protein (TIGR00299 family) protein
MAEARLAWFNCFAGIAGDMALGALLDAGADVGEVRALVERLGVPGWSLDVEPTSRNGIAASRAVVVTDEVHVERRWVDIRALLAAAALPPRVAQRAHAVFEAIAVVEARLHGTTPEHVHFHEVGALDAIVDVVGVAAALEVLAVDEVSASPVAHGVGVVRAAHGVLPNPAPAVIGLLAGHRVRGIDVPVELTTPTGAGIVAALATGTGPLPAMTIESSGFGAGSREMAELPNLTQVVVGVGSRPEPDGQPVVLLEANVDDVTGEVLASTVAALLAAGAHDAWLTPILMKKGRPAHTLSVLCTSTAVAGVREAVFRETSTLGMRELVVVKHALDRTESSVDLDGQRIRVKTALIDGRPVNTNPEWEDVLAAARALGRPAKQVLADAVALLRPR